MSSNNKRTVLFVTTSYPRFNTDISGIFLVPLVKKLKKSFFITTLAPDDQKIVFKDDQHQIFKYAIPKNLQKLAYANGIPENISKNPFLITLLLLFIVSMLFKAMLLSFKYDIIISNWLLPTGLVCSIVSKIMNKPHIVIEHSAGTHFLYNLPFRKLILNFILNNSQIIIVVSQSLKDKLISINPNSASKIAVLPIGIDPKTIPKQNLIYTKKFIEKYKLNPKSFKILFFGRHVPIKGLNILIEEITGIENITLLAAGDNNNIDKYRDMCRKNSVNAVFLGKLFSENKFQLFHLADLIVFPSIQLNNGRSEGSPVTLIEALAMGKLIIASNTGGIPYIINDGVNGLLFDPNNKGQLKQMILNITKNKQSYYNISLEAKKTSKNYHLNITSNKLINYVNKAISHERFKKCSHGVKTNFSTLER